MNKTVVRPVIMKQAFFRLHLADLERDDVIKYDTIAKCLSMIFYGQSIYVYLSIM